MKTTLIVSVLVSTFAVFAVASPADNMVTDVLVTKDGIGSGSAAVLLLILPKRSDEYFTWSLYLNRSSGPYQTGQLRDKPYRETLSIVLDQPGSYQAVIVIAGKDGVPRAIRRASLTVVPHWVERALLQWGGALIGVFSALGLLVVQKLYDTRNKVVEFRFHLLAFLRQLEDSQVPPKLPDWLATMESTPFLDCGRKCKVLDELLQLRMIAQSWYENRIGSDQAHAGIAELAGRVRARLGNL